MCELGHKNIAKAQLSQLKYLRGPLMMDLIQNIVDSIHNSPVSLSSPLPYCRLFKLQHVLIISYLGTAFNYFSCLIIRCLPGVAPSNVLKNT